jgi:cytochrome c oxidase assembly protein subunit 15
MTITANEFRPWRHWFAILTAFATLVLVGIGGLVTSHGVGMSVPDWPTSYGYNMFALPVSTWFTGGIFHEHTHRLWATIVGVLVVAQTRWLGGRRACRALLIIGLLEIVGGVGLLRLGADWKGAGHFLAGIGGVVVVAGLVWVRQEPAGGRLPALGWAAFWLVQFQGLLGGLRVVLDAHLVGEVRLGLALGVFHGCLGQFFLVLVAVIAMLTSRHWLVGKPTLTPELAGRVRWILVGATILILGQLLVGATMRHQHAGLAISDFPLAYGQWWPDIEAEAVAAYNARRVEVVAANPITAFQIGLQMVHRLMAAGILVAVSACFWVTPARTALRGWVTLWLVLILVQVALGAWTIWSNKAADVATLHVVVGALSLVTGALASLISFRRFAETVSVPLAPRSGGVVAEQPAN